MARVLILGGTGIISTPISHQLIQRGDEVTVVNRAQHGDRIPAECQVVQADRYDAAGLGAALEGKGSWDATIDMLAFEPSHVDTLFAALGGRTRQIVLCSTVDVYDRPFIRYPIRESEAPVGGLSRYGQNKAKSEAHFWELCTRQGISGTVLRPAHTYSEHGALINSCGWDTKYFHRMRQGKPVLVHGDGQSMWCSCYAADVAAAFVAALENPKADGKAYHVTSEEWMTWDDYVRTIARAMDWPAPKIVHIATETLVKVAPERFGVLLENFQYSGLYDNSSAREDLGFQPTVRLVDGMRKAIGGYVAEGKIDESPDAWMDGLIERYAAAEAALAG